MKDWPSIISFPPPNRKWAFTLLWRRNVPTEMYYLPHIHNLTFSLEVVSVCKFLLGKGLSGNCIRGGMSLDDLVIVLSRVGWPSFPFNSRKRKKRKMCLYTHEMLSLSFYSVVVVVRLILQCISAPLVRKWKEVLRSVDQKFFGRRYDGEVGGER